MQKSVQKYLGGKLHIFYRLKINRLTTVLSFEGENIMESVLRSLNLAEQVGDCPELCFAYYVAGFGFGIAGKNLKMAQEYFRRGT